MSYVGDIVWAIDGCWQVPCVIEVAGKRFSHTANIPWKLFQFRSMTNQRPFQVLLVEETRARERECTSGGQGTHLGCGRPELGLSPFVYPIGTVLLLHKYIFIVSETNGLYSPVVRVLAWDVRCPGSSPWSSWFGTQTQVFHIPEKCPNDWAIVGCALSLVCVCVLIKKVHPGPGTFFCWNVCQTWHFPSNRFDSNKRSLFCQKITKQPNCIRIK